MSKPVKLSAYALRLSLMMTSGHGTHVGAASLRKLVAVNLKPHGVVLFH